MAETVYKRMTREGYTMEAEIEALRRERDLLADIVAITLTRLDGELCYIQSGVPMMMSSRERRKVEKLLRELKKVK